MLMHDGPKDLLALGTNKHVVVSDKKGTIFDEAYIVLSKRNSNGTIKKEHIQLHISELKERCFFHPDDSIDLCLLVINDLIEQARANGIDPYFKAITTDFSISNFNIQELTPVEDIVMIGYPIGLIDEVNNKPVVRKGITATDIRLDYNGRKEFLIDAACFHGSSGSPVFLRKMGLSKEDIDNGFSIRLHPTYAFLGVLYAGPVEKVDGKIKIKTIPTSTQMPYSEHKHTINLGFVIKSEKVVELFSLIKEYTK